MREQDAIERIKSYCKTKDYEANGCLLDDIIMDFLKDKGFSKLADEMMNVECWRA